MRTSRRLGWVALLGAAALTRGYAQPAATVTDLGGGLYQVTSALQGRGVRVPQSNTFVLTTSDGAVVIDTSGPAAAPAHKAALTAAAKVDRIRAIILTHAHGDHTGGIRLWRQPATEVIAHRLYPEFLEYTARLSGYFARANVAQFGGALTSQPAAAATEARSDTSTTPTTLFAERHVLDAVDTRLEARLAALTTLDAQSTNSNERGWLAAAIRDAEARLKGR